MPDSFENRLAKVVGAENPQFVASLQKTKQALNTFFQQLQTLVNKKRFNLTTSIHGVGNSLEFQYVLNFEVLSTGTNYDLLSFLFSLFWNEEQDFPLRITTELDTHTEDPPQELGFPNIEAFEEFLVERAKNIRRTLQMLSIIADQ